MFLPVELGADYHVASMSFCLVLPHFTGLHTLSTVLSHVHKGHLADTPWLCDPYVLVAVTVAWYDLIHLKHTSADLRQWNDSGVGRLKTPVSSQSVLHQSIFIHPTYCSYSQVVRMISSSKGEG